MESKEKCEEVIKRFNGNLAPGMQPYNDRMNVTHSTDLPSTTKGHSNCSIPFEMEWQTWRDMQVFGPIAIGDDP